MPPDVNDLIEALSDMVVHTDQGSYVRVEDVRRMMEEQEKEDQAPKPQPKTMVQAKRMAMRDEELMKNFPNRITEPGRAVAAQPQPPSRA